MVAFALPSLASVGSFASGIGSLASGFGIGKDKGPGFTEQFNHNRRMVAETNRSAILGKVAGAKAAGIHPALALGASVAGATSTHHSNGGFDPAQIGQGVDRALNAGKTEMQRQLDKLTLEKAQLSNDYIRTQIAGAQQRISQAGQSVSLPANSDFNTVDGSFSDRVRLGFSDSIANRKGNLGEEAGSTPMWKRFYLDNDTYIRLPPNGSIDELGFPMSTLKSAELAFKEGKSSNKRFQKWLRNKLKKKTYTKHNMKKNRYNFR